VLYHENGDCIVVDPGFYTDDEKEQFSKFIAEKGLKPVKLINTHAHLDHIFGNKWIAEQFQLIPHLHRLEKETHENAATIGLMYNLPFDSYQGELIFLEEGDVVKLGDGEMQVIFLPGHSAGSIAFYSKQQEFIVAGDVIFKQSIGRTDLPGGDFDTLMHSIKEKLFLLPDSTKIYAGHGFETTIGEEKISNPFL
jgi:glyoxylase-like metal-dependent hydrolase (beta-lactamase superfamily II)